VIAFQFADGENPSKIFRSDGLQMSVDTNGEMVVIPGYPEIEDTFQVKEAVYDFLPFFIIDGVQQTTLILSFF
jgi:hypothetical protein